MSWRDDLQRDFNLDAPRLEALSRLLDILLAASDRNLSAVTSEEGIVRVHFRDSLSLLSLSEVMAASKAIDIGSGAGFPGLPLAICLPGAEFTLLESNMKKCEFIRSAAAAIGLRNVTVTPARAETAGRSEMRDSFDLALARAVGPLPVTIEYAAPFLRTGGFAVLQRGARVTGDTRLAEVVAPVLGARLSRVVPMQPYAVARDLNIWVFEKSEPTPDRFPRKPGLAKKRPLGR